ncbi:MAG TPA: GNAT family N-acetyltransferase [Pyrinomonadaceae bacterium]|nr:GNAT family N-acetyltransferase [Pyrinomonadaceae bacterium]
MILRPYGNNDLEDVVAIFRSNIPKYFGPIEEPGLRDFLAIRTEDYFVGEVNGEIVAAGGIALNEDQTVSLCWGMVRQDHLGTGLGRKLTEFRVQMSIEKHGKLPLVISTSQHTQAFYEKFGFRLTEHEPNGFGPGIDTCKMRLDF